ncbi:MAG TPA: ABC transporter ATP-binding protein [Lutibacter sp.]
MSNIILKVENLSKQYRLGLVGTGTMGDDLKRWWANIRGKEDPFLKIGDVNNRATKGTSDYVWALKDINFEVQQGEVLGIIGKNGAGKSTLLKILSKITAPTTGSIKSKGRVASLLEVGTGFHGEMTGRENIFLNGAILGMTKKEITGKLDEIIEFSGCERYIDTPVKRYSSGMTVRLAFAVAAFLEPDILIIDEVLAVGDAEFQKKAIGKMQEISAGGGRTVLFVSHNMAAVQSLCTRAILIENGSIKIDGDTKYVINDYLSNRFTKTDITEIELITSTCKRLILKTPYFVDADLSTKYNHLQGDITRLFFHLNFLEEFKNIVIGVAMEDVEGNRIITSHSIDDSFFKISKRLIGKIDFLCEINTKNLAPGNYNIMYGIRDEANNNILKSENQLPIFIEEINKIDGSEGIFRNVGSWKII